MSWGALGEAARGRLGLGRGGAACVAASARLVALGTASGSVLLVDPSGACLVREEAAHRGRVTDLGFDAGAEFVASCSEDGTVAVRGLYCDEATRVDLGKPVLAVALDPQYRARKSRQIMCGGQGGRLVLHYRGWMGQKSHTLSKGGGCVRAVRWAGNLVAWASDLGGVRVWDMVSQQCVQQLGAAAPPEGALSAPGTAKLAWVGSQQLITGWGRQVSVYRVGVAVPAVEPLPGGTETDGVGGGGAAASAGPGSGEAGGMTVGGGSGAAGVGGSLETSGTRPKLDLVASFSADSCVAVAGIAPFGPNIALLTRAPAAEGGGLEIRITTPDGALLATERPPAEVAAGGGGEGTADNKGDPGGDSLACLYPESVLARAARLAPGAEGDAGAAGALADAEAADRALGQWWEDGDEPQYFVVSPVSVAVGKPSGAQDRVTWLLDHERHEEALEIIDTGKAIDRVLVEDVSSQYLSRLLEEGRFAEAAAECPKLLGSSAELWEEWAEEFIRRGKLPALLPHLPTGQPCQLGVAAYDRVLLTLLEEHSDHEALLHAVLEWPSALYSLIPLIDSVKGADARGRSSPKLQEALAELYVLQGRRDLALGIFLELRRPGTLEYLETHRLFFAVADKVAPLVRLDPARAVALLVEHYDELPPEEVVVQLEALAAGGAAPGVGAHGDGQAPGAARAWLHDYLHRLFVKDPQAGARYHPMQIELYAEHDPRNLLPFLTSSNHYQLEEALATCERHSLIDEMVYILGRMGNNKQALRIIIERQGDTARAMEFVRTQRDRELWEELMALGLESPDLMGTLLDHVGGFVDPRELLQRVPAGMAIPGLKGKVTKIITDFRTQAALVEGCNRILRSDRSALAERLYQQSRRALPLQNVYFGEGDQRKRASSTL